MLFPSRLMEAVWVFFLLVQFAGPAPVQETLVRLGRLPRMQGCYFKSDHFENGERIFTQESCLNCTCIDSTVMCYLRVCPFVKPLGEHCIEVKNEDDCCPTFHCPEVAKEKDCHDSTHNHDQPGCFLNDTYYPDGAMLPPDPKKPCEVCYCIRNSTSCVVQECELKIEGCSPMYKPGQCCPCRYNCSYGVDSTTVPPGYTVEDLSDGCMMADERFIPDGEAVNSTNPCEHCYCMRNEVVCAIQECQAPGDNCKPLPIKQGQCCPDQYDCPSSNESSDSSIPPTSNLSIIDKVNLSKISKEASAVRPEEVDLASDDSIMDNESVELTKHAETDESDYKIAPEEVTKDYETSTEDTQTIFSAEDFSKDHEIVTEVTHLKVSDDKISKHDKVEVEMTNEPEEIPKKYEKPTEVTQPNDSVEDAPKDDKTSIDERPSTVPSKDITKAMNTFSMENPPATDVSSHSEEAAVLKETATKETDAVKLSPKGIIRKITPSEKLESDREKPKFAQKGVFEEIPLYKPTPPPNMVNDYFPVSRTKDVPKSTTMSPSSPPMVHNPYKLPNSILRIRGQNTTKVIPGVTAIYEHPRPSLGIKGGVFNITIPTGAFQGVKGSGYSFKGGVVYPNRHKPILPVGAIPGEKNQGSSIKLPGMSTIPGEGNCQVGKVTYRSGYKVPSSEPCKTNCHCIHGVIYCDRVICEPPPERNCVIYHFTRECCPHYQCDTLEPVSETEEEKSQDEQPTVPTLLDTKPLHAEHEKDFDATTLIPSSDITKTTGIYEESTPGAETTKETDYITKETADFESSTIADEFVTKENTQSGLSKETTLHKSSADKTTTQTSLEESGITLFTTNISTESSSAVTLETTAISSKKEENLTTKTTIATPLKLTSEQILETSASSTVLKETTTLMNDYVTETGIQSTEFDTDAFTKATVIDHSKIDQSKNLSSTLDIIIENTTILDDKTRNDTDITSSSSTVATIMSNEDLKDSTSGQEDLSDKDALSSDTQQNYDELKITQVDSDTEKTHFENKDFTISSGLQESDIYTITDEAPILTSENVEHGGVTTEFPKDPSSFPTVRDSVTTQSHDTEMPKDTHSTHTVTSKISITKLKDYEELLPTTSVFLKETMPPDVLLAEAFSLETTSEVHETSSPVKHSEELSESVTTQKTGLNDEDKNYFHITTTSSLPVTTIPTEISKSLPTTMTEPEKEKTHFDKTTLSPAAEYADTEIALINKTPVVIPEKTEYKVVGSDVDQTTLSKDTTTEDTIKILDLNEIEEHIVITAIPVQPTSTQSQGNEDAASSVIFVEEENKITNSNENQYLAPPKSTSITEMPLIEEALDESNKIPSKPTVNLENITFLHDKDNLSEETIFITSKTSASTEDSGSLRTSNNKTLALGNTELSDDETIITQEPFGFTEITRSTPENLQEKDPADFDLEKNVTIPNILTSEQQTSEDLSSIPSITEEKDTTTYSSGNVDLIFTTVQGSESSSTVNTGSFESQPTISTTIKEGTTHLNQEDVNDADETTLSSTVSKVTTAEVPKTTPPLTSSAESFEKLPTIHTTTNEGTSINEGTTSLHQEDASDNDEAVQTSTISEITTFEFPKTISPETGTEENSEPSSTLFTTINYGTILLHQDDVNAIYQIIPSLSDSKITTAEIPNKTSEGTSSAESSGKLSTVQTTINERITSFKEDVSDGDETMPYTTVSKITTEKILEITSPSTSLAESSEKISTAHTIIEEGTTFLHEDVSHVNETIPYSTVSKITTAKVPEETSPETGSAESSETLSTIQTTINKGTIILPQEDFSNIDEIIPSTVSKSTTAEILKMTSPGTSSEESTEGLSTVHTTINKETTISHVEDISNGDETIPSSTVSKITTVELPKMTSTRTGSEETSEKLSTVITTINERITFSDEKDVSNLDETLPSSIPSKITTDEIPNMTSLVTSLAESSGKLSTIHKTINDGTTILYQEDVSDGDKTVPSSTGLKITTAQVPNMASQGADSAESYEKRPTAHTIIHKETIILDQEDASDAETIPTSTLSKIVTAEFLETTSPGTGSTEFSENLSTVRTTNKDGTTFIHQDASDGDETKLSSTVLKFKTTEIPKMSSPVIDSESSEKLPITLTVINEKTTFLDQKDASEIIEFDREVSTVIPETGDSVDATEISSDSIYEKKFTEKRTTNEDENEVNEVADHENDEEVSSIPNITTTFLPHTEITEVPDASLETENPEKPSSFMSASPEQLVFSETKTTQYPKNTITTSLQTTFESETSSHYPQEITTTSTASFDHRTSEHDINIQHPENQETHTTTFSIIKETEQDILSSQDKNISHFNYTSLTFDINENITITVPQTDFTENYSEIKSTEDIFHTENAFLSSENVSVLTTQTPNIISTIKPQHLSENTLDKDIISANTDTKVQSTDVSTETDTGTSTEQFSENYDTKIKTQTSKYPLLISEEIHEYENNEIKDKSLIGHKIKDAEKEISFMLAENLTMEGISQIHQASSIPHGLQNIGHTTIKEFLDTKSELPTSSSTAPSLIPIDVIKQEFSTTFTASEEAAKTPLKTEITTPAEDSSFYDFSTHDDTIIERETLPQLTMQSPESLVSHSESLQEKLSTLSPIKLNISTPIDKETSIPFTFPTTDQETIKPSILDPRNFTTKNMDILMQTTLTILSTDKGSDKQTSTTDISGLKIQPQDSGSEFISDTTTEKSPDSTVELTQGIGFPGDIMTKMPVEILESEAKVPEGTEVNTPDIINQELPSSTSSHSLSEITPHYLPTTIDNLFESSKTGSTEDLEAGVKSNSSLPYPEFIINKSDISTAQAEFTEESTTSQELLATDGSTKDIHYETEVESIASSQYPEFIVNKSDISIGKPEFTEESTIYKGTLVTGVTTKGTHYETGVESTSSSLSPEYIVNKSDISTEKPGFVEESTIPKETTATDGSTKDIHYETELESITSSSRYPAYIVNKSYTSTEKPGFVEESTIPKETMATDGSTKDIHYETGAESTSSSSLYPEYIVNKSYISTSKPGLTEESTIATDTLDIDGSTKDIHYESEVDSTLSSLPDLEFTVNKSDISTGKLEFTQESTMHKETLAIDVSTEAVPLTSDGTTKDFHSETVVESTSLSPYPEYTVNKSDISARKPGFTEESTISKETLSTDESTKEVHYENELESTSSTQHPEYIVNKFDISTGKPKFTEESTISKETLSTDESTKEVHYENELESTSSTTHPEYIINKSDISIGKPGFTEESTIYKETLSTDASTKEVNYENELESTSSTQYPEYLVNKFDISTGKPKFTEESTISKETLSTDESTKEVYYENELESTSSTQYPEYIVNKFDISTGKPGFTEESTISKETLSTDGSTKEIHYGTEEESTSSTTHPEYIINKFDISTEKPGFTEESTISKETLSTDGSTKGIHYGTEEESTSSTTHPEYIINKSDISTGKTGFTEESTIPEETLATGESNEGIHYVTNIESISSSLYPEFKVNESYVSTRKPVFTEDSTILKEMLATDADTVKKIYISTVVPLSFDSNKATDSFSTKKQPEIILVNQTGQSFSLEDINSETIDINSFTKPEKIPSSTMTNHSGFTDTLSIHFTEDNIFDSTTTSKYTESTTVKTEEQPSTVPDLTTLITETSLHDVTTQQPSDLTMKYITTTADYMSSTKEIVKDITITPHIVREQSTTEEVITIKPENATIVDMTTSSTIHNVGVKLGSNDVFDILTDINKDNEILNAFLTSTKNGMIIDDTTSNTDDPSMLKNVSEIRVTSLSTDEMHTRPSINLQTEISDLPGTELTNISLSQTFEKDNETNQTKESGYSTLTWSTENKSSTLTESQDKETTAFSTNIDYSTTSTPSSNIGYVPLTSDDSYSKEIQNISSTDIFKEDNLTTSTEPLSDLYSTQDENASDTKLISLDHQSTLTDDKESTTSQVTHVGNLTEELQSFTTTSPENIIYNITAKREYESNTTPTTSLKKTEEKFSIMPDLTVFSTQTDLAEQTTLPSMEEIDFNTTILTTKDQPFNDNINATEVEVSNIHSTTTSISSKDEFSDDDKNATEDFEIHSTPSTVIPKDQVLNENKSTTVDLIKKTSIVPEKDIEHDKQTVTDFFTSTIHIDERIPVTSEKFDNEKSNHSALSGASSGWMTHPLEDNIVKALSTIFPSNPDTMVYETHSFPTGTAVYGTHVNQESGVCYFEGKVYLSSEQIPREDNCEFCFCFKGDIICLQQTCPPPISGCYSIPIDGFCCPRFHCPVQQMWFGLPSSTTTTTSQPLGKSPHRQYPTPGCQIEGKSYRLHQIVQRSSNPCMLCRCDYGGIMKCEPRSCKPGPPMIQEIAEAFFRRR